MMIVLSFRVARFGVIVVNSSSSFSFCYGTHLVALVDVMHIHAALHIFFQIDSPLLLLLLLDVMIRLVDITIITRRIELRS